MLFRASHVNIPQPAHPKSASLEAASRREINTLIQESERQKKEYCHHISKLENEMREILEQQEALAKSHEEIRRSGRTSHFQTLKPTGSSWNFQWVQGTTWGKAERGWSDEGVHHE